MYPDWKKRKTVCICRRHDLIERNPEESTKKLLELKNEFSKVAEYKVNVQKSVVFLNASNELFEVISIMIALKRIKYLRINITKEV